MTTIIILLIKLTWAVSPNQILLVENWRGHLTCEHLWQRDANFQSNCCPHTLLKSDSNA